MKYQWKHDPWDMIFHVMNKHKVIRGIIQTKSKARTKLKEIASNVMQYAKKGEVTSKSGQNPVRGTIKAAILGGDAERDSIISVSGYDTKPIHF
eukprot:15329427-Ditylum_brightwellii.AAC.1